MHSAHYSRVMAATLAFALTLPAPMAAAAGPHVVGWVERLTLYPAGVTLKAKIDSGAKTTSLAVEHSERFIRDGAPWVRFEVSAGGGRRIVLERPEVRSVRIKRHGAAAQARPVVMLELCLDSVLKRTEVDLTDRAGFLYPLLVGRRFLRGDFLIDPGRTFIAEPACERQP